MSEHKKASHVIKARSKSSNGLSGNVKIPTALQQSLTELSRLAEQVRSSTLFDIEIDAAALDAGREFLIRLWRLIAEEAMTWHPPHLGTEDHGDVEFSWWRGEKTLLISVTGQEIRYLRVWGANIQSEMDEGQDPSDADLVNLWRWLVI
jgi:hypothetical protein